ncbi:MAG: YraN family protein [Ignavibacteria bacterium]|nr:YraN family protein [Ignavibacteria bacterium]
MALHIGGGWRKQRGNRGEDLALDYLRSRGYHVLARNYRFERGEIDLIAEDGEVIVFVEVKTRRSMKYGQPEHSVTLRKQNQIRKVAEGYLHEHEMRNRPCRFDVLAITMTYHDPTIIHYRNAFY